jgi:hypothetical protein
VVSSSRTSAPAAKRQSTVEAASETVWYKNLIQSQHLLHSKHRAHKGCFVLRFNINETDVKRQLPFVFCIRKRKTDVCFPWSANRQTVIDDCRFSKHAHLCICPLYSTINAIVYIYTYVHIYIYTYIYIHTRTYM